jgi:2,4-dienoyl-CoA reductase-like NADH-dependent reductase (Old Yellow Enzyme family)/NADPH-dependent 2,4-dienoyl-CoA reductase/sulfur reductase-like enzyme
MNAAATAPEPGPFDTLLSPLRVGSMTVPNRVVSTAHGAFLDFYRPGVSGDRYVAYQERRARGGTGLIIMQPMHVHPSSQALGHYAYDPADMRPKMAAMERAVHRHGTGLLVQLLHFGAEFRSDANDDLRPLWSFSGTPSPSGAEVSHRMTSGEIEAVIDGFASTAAFAVECGLDGVELSASHGYLLQQSFTPAYNTRTDEWGEPLRFITAVIDAIRGRIGRRPVLGVRMSADDFLAPERGGLGPKGLLEVAHALAATGSVDFLNQSEGSRAAHYGRSIGTYHHPHGEFLSLAGPLRAAGGLPLIGTGKITTPELAERALTDGSCDLVAMTRQQIADPDFVVKVRTGRTARIRPCVGANQGCVDRMVGGLPITCFHNPDVGRERRVDAVSPAAPPRTVLVVGGGPAGLKAAEVAARRGHRVVLADRSGTLGGRLLRAGHAAKAELLKSVQWLINEFDTLVVDVRLGTTVDTDLVGELRPDVVVLATGATTHARKFLADYTDGSVVALTIDEAMTVDAAGRDVVVLDHLGTADVYTAAERLAGSGATVGLVTPMPTIAGYVGFTHLKDLQQRLYTAGVTQLTTTALTAVTDGRVVVTHVYSKDVTTVPADFLVAAVPATPNLDLQAGLDAAGIPTLVVGDANAPRTALHAFRDGADAGAAL